MRTAQIESQSQQNVSSKSKDHPDWAKLLTDAVNTPGVISTAYSRFWNYSVGNQILAMIQCVQRGLEPGPIHTFKGWLDLGRHVKKGEKAITLCMPLVVKRKISAAGIDPATARTGDGAERQLTGSAGGVPGADGSFAVMVFAYRPHWFVLNQTDGEPYLPRELPLWSEAAALQALEIERIAFNHPNGNCQGYALHRTVAVSPLAALPHKTLFHELAHIVLGHTEEGYRIEDHEFTPCNLREVEAECVGLICCESLKLPGQSRVPRLHPELARSGNHPRPQRTSESSKPPTRSSRPAEWPSRTKPASEKIARNSLVAPSFSILNPLLQFFPERRPIWPLQPPVPLVRRKAHSPSERPTPPSSRAATARSKQRSGGTSWRMG